MQTLPDPSLRGCVTVCLVLALTACGNKPIAPPRQLVATPPAAVAIGESLRQEQSETEFSKPMRVVTPKPRSASTTQQEGKRLPPDKPAVPSRETAEPTHADAPIAEPPVPKQPEIDSAKPTTTMMPQLSTVPSPPRDERDQASGIEISPSRSTASPMDPISPLLAVPPNIESQQFVASLPVPPAHLPPVPLCEEETAAALKEYDDARRQNSAPNVVALFADVAAALAKADQRCPAIPPSATQRRTLALANALYYSQQYKAAAEWYTKAASGGGSSNSSSLARQLGRMLTECGYDTVALDLARQGSLMLVGQPDDETARRAADYFTRAYSAASCANLRAMAKQSATAVRMKKMATGGNR